MHLLILSFLLLITSHSSFATYGVDVSDLISESTFQCLLKNGYSYAIVRCWRSVGSPDPNCPATIKNAWNAGLDNVDVYIFPCYHCGNPKDQVQQTVNYLQSHNSTYNMVWFDVEGPQYWSNVTEDNVVFFQEMLDEAIDLDTWYEELNIGIYSSKHAWPPIMGDWTGGSIYPLWYPHYNNQTNFDDFVPFNGWTSPVMKQYLGDAMLCNADVDLDWYPDSL